MTETFIKSPTFTLAKLDLLAWRVLSFLPLTHNFICESNRQSLQDQLYWACPDTKPPLCDFKQSTAAQPVLPITVHDCVRKKSTFKKKNCENWEQQSNQWQRRDTMLLSSSAHFLGLLPNGTKFPFLQRMVSADLLWISQVSHRR